MEDQPVRKTSEEPPPLTSPVDQSEDRDSPPPLQQAPAEDEPAHEEAMETEEKSEEKPEEKSEEKPEEKEEEKMEVEEAPKKKDEERYFYFKI